MYIFALCYSNRINYKFIISHALKKRNNKIIVHVVKLCVKIFFFYKWNIAYGAFKKYFNNVSFVKIKNIYYFKNKM